MQQSLGSQDHTRPPLKVAALAAIDGSLCGRFIQALLARGVQLTAVIVDARRQLARDRALHQERTGDRMPPIDFESLDEHHVPFYFVRDHNGPACVGLLHKLGVELLVNAGTPRILKEELLAIPGSGTLNCHPGLLPHFRGCSAVEWALLLDEPVGNTVHLMSPAIDEGPVVAQELVEITPNDTYQDVRCRVYQAGIDLLARTTLALQSGRLRSRQAAAQSAGRYFPPIPPAAMAEVLDKLRRGAYGPRHQPGTANAEVAGGGVGPPAAAR
jgi:methionyl-tRNA formyltransferase